MARTVLVIDYYSNYPEVAQLTNTSAQSVIIHMKSFFARHGIPQCVVSDNGPQYNCVEFREFAKQYGFQHTIFNGQAKKGVQIVKRLLKKASNSNTDPYLDLVSYQMAALECGASPAEFLMHHKLHTTLPHISTENDKINSRELTNKRIKLKLKQIMNYDRAARRL